MKEEMSEDALLWRELRTERNGTHSVRLGGGVGTETNGRPALIICFPTDSKLTRSCLTMNGAFGVAYIHIPVADDVRWPPILLEVRSGSISKRA
jgi:hypothetical protein